MATGTEADELAQAVALSAEDEEKLLRGVFESGLDQGCFLTPEEVGPPLADAHAWIEAFEGRERPPRLEFEADPNPTGLAHTPPEIDVGYVVISQRCDLLDCLQREPFIELMRCEKRRGEYVGEASKNSPCFGIVHRPAGKEAWLADARDKIKIPKTRAKNFGPLKQALADGDYPRAEFASWVGRRYSRKALPDEFVRGIQIPLKILLLGEHLADSAIFRDWIIIKPRDGGRPYIYAAIDNEIRPGKSAEELYQITREAETLAGKIVGKLGSDAHKLIDRQRVIAGFEDEMSHYQWLEGYPIDLREVTTTATIRRAKAQRSGNIGQHKNQAAPPPPHSPSAI